MTKLHLGCGRDIRQGWINVDHRGGPGVDITASLDDPFFNLRIPDGSVTEIFGAHVLEHLRDPLPMMAELYRVASVDCLATFRVPYGSSDDAWEDPTHVRPMFLQSWQYYGQPVYWRADYGYRGDWQIETIDLLLTPMASELDDGEIPAAVAFSRNMVREMIGTLRPIKPRREARKDLMVEPAVRYLRAPK